MKRPLVSAIIAVYNGERYIRDAVESILADELRDIEVVVVDDGSTDATREVLSHIADDRIVVLENGVNRGVAASFNRAMENATGGYIAFLGADDINLPHRLRTQFEFMEKNRDIGLLGSWMKTFGSRRRVMRYPERDADIKMANLFTCSIGHPSVVIRTEPFRRHGLLFDETLNAGVDYELWSRAEAAGIVFHNLPEVLVRYRTHAGQVTSRRREEQLNNDRMVKRYLLGRLGIAPTEEELALHCDMMFRKTAITDTADLPRYEAWAHKLLEANRRTRIYPAGFEEYLRQWMRDAYASCAARSGQMTMAPGFWTRG
ncbi:MAG TPA: glycosyltransferase [bacterium]|nr:glycosyltransferase [bacterium]